MNSAYGKHLYDLLPEVYRERDRELCPNQRPHLENYLDGHGVLLDRVRNTLEQMYADHFPDIPDGGRSCQAWIIPYLADLVGAAPVSPFADGQRDEVAKAIHWSKRKGTLTAVEDIVETVALSETEIQEGWKRVVVSARPDDAILPASFYGDFDPNPIDAILAEDDPTTPFTTVNPQTAALHPGLRAATIDFREISRAVQAPLGQTGAEASRFNSAPWQWPRDDNAPAEPRPAPTGWRQHEMHGAPCFPDSYEDVSQRIVDMRSPDPAGTNGRYHPKSLIIYLPPPFGLCPPSPVVVPWPQESEWEGHATLERIQPTADDPRLIIRNRTAGSVQIGADLIIGPVGDIVLPAGATLRLEKLRFDKTLTLAAGKVELERCAVREFAFAADAAKRSLNARSVLFDTLSGGDADIRLEFCTILGKVVVAAKHKINASETIFPDGTAADVIACARYSRLPPDVIDPTIVGLSPASNTDVTPLFVSGVFCTPGAGVLRPDASGALLEGAEDGTEMGACHDWRYAVLREAILRKLSDYLPMGLRPVIAFDARLLCMPPKLNIP